MQDLVTTDLDIVFQCLVQNLNIKWGNYRSIFGVDSLITGCWDDRLTI
jgi:hypothetical protein